MCFSANASFVASGVLAVAGAAAIKETRTRRALPYAFIPLLFAIQQFIEGWQWLSAKNGGSEFFGYGFLFFAVVLWPVYIPIAVYLIEPRAGKQKIFGYFIALGAAVSIFSFVNLFFSPIEVIAESCCHVRYVFELPFRYVIGGSYIIATCGSLFFSSHKWVKIMSAVIFLSLTIAYSFAQLAYISVWCFFAALLSVLVFFGIRSLKKQTVV